MILNRINVNALAVVGQTHFDGASLYSLAGGQVRQLWAGEIHTWEKLTQLVRDSEGVDYIVVGDSKTGREYGLSRTQLDATTRNHQ